MHPDDHRAQHMADGDFRRWGGRAHANRQAAAIPIGPEMAPEPKTAAPQPGPPMLMNAGPKAPAKPRPRVPPLPAPGPTPSRIVAPRPAAAPAKPGPTLAARPPAQSASGRPPAATKPKTPPLRGGPGLRGFGFLPLLTGVTGVLSGRIRTDTPMHFWSDMAGVPSPDDYAPKPGAMVWI
jgi:outer membrane biosynthesis protein TonB